METHFRADAGVIHFENMRVMRPDRETSVDPEAGIVVAMTGPVWSSGPPPGFI
jgi:hypothetical protein